MRIKKRRKSSRYRGSQTARRGAKERTRHSGNRGGYGFGGTGKMAGQKKTLILNLYGNDYFGKSKALRRGPAPFRPEVINIGDIESKLSGFVKNGIAKETKDHYEIKLDSCKILGSGEIKQKFHIIAHSASRSAIDKIRKAGGSVSLTSQSSEKSEVKEANEEKKIKTP